jgi:hypothetical protein
MDRRRFSFVPNITAKKSAHQSGISGKKTPAPDTRALTIAHTTAALRLRMFRSPMTLMGIVSSKLRASAKGQPCALAIPGICSHDPEQTVLCHLPSEVKGTGNKSDDFFAVLGCSQCHICVDNHRLKREDELYYYASCIGSHMAILGHVRTDFRGGEYCPSKASF